MSYDSSLDKKLFAKEWEGEGTKITIAVFSYNNGAKKLQIGRENASDGEFRFAKLGRMTKDEVAAIVPHLQEAIGHMD